MGAERRSGRNALRQEWFEGQALRRRGAQGATGAGEGAALEADPEAGACPESLAAGLDAPCEPVRRSAPLSPEAGASDDDSPEDPPSSPPERSEE